MRKYVFEVTIEEGNDELWEDIRNRESTGCDDILKDLQSILDNWAIKDNIILKRFEDNG